MHFSLVSRRALQLQLRIISPLSLVENAVCRSIYVIGRNPFALCSLSKELICLVNNRIMSSTKYFIFGVNTCSIPSSSKSPSIFLVGLTLKTLATVSSSVTSISTSSLEGYVQQTYRAPKVYPELPSRDHREEYAEAELGLKIACGMEMMYQSRKRDGAEGKGSAWEAFGKSLEKSGYFERLLLLLGSSEYQRLMLNAQEYFLGFFNKDRCCCCTSDCCSTRNGKGCGCHRIGLLQI